MHELRAQLVGAKDTSKLTKLTNEVRAHAQMLWYQLCRDPLCTRRRLLSIPLSTPCVFRSASIALAKTSFSRDA